MKIKNESQDSLLSFQGGGLSLGFDKKAGMLHGVHIQGDSPFLWTDGLCRVRIRDDMLRKTFDERDVAAVTYECTNANLVVRKQYNGAPWECIEHFQFSPDEVRWDSQIVMPKGEFRSCAISFAIPWPKDPKSLGRMKLWAPKCGMPIDMNRLPNTFLEHGDICGGINFPSVAVYWPSKDAGLLMTVPFDFQTPRPGFNAGMRTRELEAVFDWLALHPNHSAESSLIFRAIGGDWRPAFRWIVGRFPEFFKPRCTSISNLWGGTVAGNPILSKEEARACSQLDLAWYEIHRHFYAYGNYHPEGLDEWQSGETVAHDEYVKLDTVSVDAIRQTIQTLHNVNAAAMMYIQVNGDGDTEKLPKECIDEKVIDAHGQTISCWQGTIALNSDDHNAFGKDITRQIDGMVDRYPDMDGVFLDQACYNFQDYAHDDGITAIDNRPCYMTGFAYLPHLEHLSRLLHPHKSIIANGPHSIGIMQYVDGFILEAQDWLAEQLQYYAVYKPMFFLSSRTKNTRETIERMFQQCLIFAGGFTSYAHFQPFKDLYDLYVPLIRKLYNRTWIFDANPLMLPNGFRGNIYRSPSRNLLIPVVRTMSTSHGESADLASIHVRTEDISHTLKVLMHSLGGSRNAVPYRRENNSLTVEIPLTTVAAIIEIVIHAD